MSLLNKIAKSLFLLFSIAVLDVNAQDCDHIRFTVSDPIDNGDGTYTYTIEACVDNAASEHYKLEGIAFILEPSDVNIVSAAPNLLNSGSSFISMKLGNDISSGYLTEPFSDYNGAQNVVTWEYDYNFSDFDPAKQEVCFINENDPITITVDRLLDDITGGLEVYYDSYIGGDPCLNGPTGGMPVTPCTLGVDTIFGCEFLDPIATNVGTTYAQFDLTSIDVGQTGNITLTYADGSPFIYSSGIPSMADVEIPFDQEYIELIVIDDACDQSTGSLFLKRGIRLNSNEIKITTCESVVFGDLEDLFYSGTDQIYTTWTNNIDPDNPIYDVGKNVQGTGIDMDTHEFDLETSPYIIGGVDNDGYRMFWLELSNSAYSCVTYAHLYIKSGDFQVTSSELIECSSTGTANFNLADAESAVSSQGTDYTWYSNIGLTNEIPLNEVNSYSSDGSSPVYVDVANDVGCPNSFAEVKLSISTAVAEPIIPDTVESCGVAGINLNDFNSTVDPSGLLDLTWYTNQDFTNKVLDTSNYSTTGTVYAQVVDSTGECSDFASLNIVAGNVETVDVDLSFCPNEEGEIVLDLMDYADTLSNGGFVSKWQNVFDQEIRDEDVVNYSTSSETTIVTAIITDDACQGEANFTITMSSGPSVSDHLVEACADGSGSANFDLTAYEPDISTEANLTFTYYTDASIFFPVADESDLTVSLQTDIYVNVMTAEGCQSNAVLTVIPSPVISQYTERILCDNDNSGDEAFNLDELKATVTNNNLQYNVTWYKDTNDINSGIFFPGSYLSVGGEEVFANVEHPTLGCSAWATVLLSIGNIEARDTAISTCDYNDGQVLIDLTNANAAINNGTNNSVDYYNDPGLTLAVSDPSAYVLNNGIDTVYAQVVFGDCESIARVFLSALSAPVLYNGIIDACNEGSQTGIFDLSATETDITAGQVYENGRFTTDPSGNNEIFFTSSYSSSNATIFYHTDNQGCASMATLDLKVSGLDVTNSFLTSCEDSDGNGLYDLSSITSTVTNGNGYDVTWFEDVDFTVEITDITNYSTNNGYAFGQVEYGSCADTIVLVELFIEDVEANATSLEGCGLNGVGNFDLNIALVNVKNSPGNKVSFYYDSTGTNVIDTNMYSNFINTDGSKVYAIVSDELGCSDTSLVTLNVNELPNVSSDVPNLFGCDYSQNGTGVFNILDVENTVTGGQGGYTFLYYLDENSTDEIQGNLEQYISTSSTIFFVISDGLCENNGNITLNVANAPAANPVIIDGCDGDLDNLALFDLSGAESNINTNSNLDFTWSNETGSLSGDLSSFESGSGNLSIQVLEPSTGCSTITSATLTLNQDIPNIFFKSNCLDNRTQFVYSSAGSFENAIWTFEENQTAQGTLVSYEFTSEDIYTVTVSGNSGNCNFEASTEVEVNSFTVQGMEDQTIFEGESVDLFTDLSDDETIIHSWIGDYIDDPNSNNPIAFPQILEGNNIFSYTVEVMNEDSCLASADFFIEVDAERNSGTSTIFTPNDDGENDVFKIEGSGICDIDLNIFNRWGQVVFHGENPGDGWDGTVNGKKQPIDGYAFTAKITYCNEEEETMNGIITLIR